MRKALVHVVPVCAVVASSRQKTMKITNCRTPTLEFYVEFYVEFAWVGTLEGTARHLYTLIKPPTFDNERWIKKPLAAMVKTLIRAENSGLE